jgi:hypothetical protein
MSGDLEQMRFALRVETGLVPAVTAPRASALEGDDAKQPRRVVLLGA